MSIEERRARERAARHRLILDAARRVAESEGWDAVTTRRLSAEIEYSQPVLYKHFSSMDAIAETLALEGFTELGEALRAARTGTDVLESMARAYTDFADRNPALYDAMFSRSTGLTFASDDTPTPLKAAFAELRGAVAAVGGEEDADSRTEVFWAALHGLVMLGRSGRLRPHLDHERIRVLVGAQGFHPR
jgi:AcrR family transcriptional regulator